MTLRSLHLRIVLAAALCMPLAGLANDAMRVDGKTLREAVRQKQLVSLLSIMEWIEKRYYGTIVEVELEHEDEYDTLVYEVDLVTPAGAKLEFEFDAHTGKLLELEGHDPEAARKPNSPRP